MDGWGGGCTVLTKKKKGCSGLLPWSSFNFSFCLLAKVFYESECLCEWDVWNIQGRPDKRTLKARQMDDYIHTAGDAGYNHRYNVRYDPLSPRSSCTLLVLISHQCSLFTVLSYCSFLPHLSPTVVHPKIRKLSIPSHFLAEISLFRVTPLRVGSQWAYSTDAGFLCNHRLFLVVLSLFSNSGKTAKMAKGHGFASLFFLLLLLRLWFSVCTCDTAPYATRVPFWCWTEQNGNKRKGPLDENSVFGQYTLTQAHTPYLFVHTYSLLLSLRLCLDRNKELVVLNSLKTYHSFLERSGLYTELSLAWLGDGLFHSSFFLVSVSSLLFFFFFFFLRFGTVSWTCGNKSSVALGNIISGTTQIFQVFLL